MYARSIVAILAAIATFGFVAASVQAAPTTGLNDLGTTTGKVLTRVGFEICEVCEVVQDDDDDDEGSDVTDMLMMGVDLF